MLTRSEILANRRKWIDFLKNKDLKKARMTLDEDDGRRCCLGHGCYVLGIKRNVVDNYVLYGKNEEDELAPKELVDMVGLWDNRGHVWDGSFELKGAEYDSLVRANDATTLDIQPWEIGEYLETVIKGGIDTPFIPIDKYD